MIKYEKTKKNKIFLSVTLAVLLALQFSLSAFGYTFITTPKGVKGSDFTDVEAFAKALDGVFAGDIDAFNEVSCKTETLMPVGYVMDTSATFYVKSGITGVVCSGKQCYIYANAVYNKLFGDWPGHGKTSEKFEMAVSQGSKTISYDMFKNADVRCGAYVRTTSNSDGSYSSNYGHSFIILGYDKSAVTYLEGNSDGKGLVRVTVRTWDEVNQALLTGKNRRVSHIVQPNKEYFTSLYGTALETPSVTEPAIPTHTHVYHEVFRAEPQCLEKGIATYFCQCGDCYTEVTPAAGHFDEDNDGICENCLKSMSFNDPTTGSCDCACHSKLPFRLFFHRIKCIICLLAGEKQYEYCDCGARHYGG